LPCPLGRSASPNPVPQNFLHGRLFRLRVARLELEPSVSPRPTLSPRPLQKKRRERHRAVSMPLFAGRKAPDGIGMSGDAAASAAAQPKEIAAARITWGSRMSPSRWHGDNYERTQSIPGMFLGLASPLLPS